MNKSVTPFYLFGFQSKQQQAMQLFYSDVCLNVYTKGKKARAGAGKFGFLFGERVVCVCIVPGTL